MLQAMEVRDGVESSVQLQYAGGFSYLGLGGEDFSSIEKKLLLPETMQAPVAEGEKAGVLRYELKGKALGEVEILTAGSVEKAGFSDYLCMVFRVWSLACGNKDSGKGNVTEVISYNIGIKTIAGDF